MEFSRRSTLGHRNGAGIDGPSCDVVSQTSLVVIHCRSMGQRVNYLMVRIYTVYGPSDEYINVKGSLRDRQQSLRAPLTNLSAFDRTPIMKRHNPQIQTHRNPRGSQQNPGWSTRSLIEALRPILRGRKQADVFLAVPKELLQEIIRLSGADYRALEHFDGLRSVSSL